MSLGSHTVSTRSLFVAGLQIAPVPLDPGATLERFEEQVRGAAALFDGLQLVIAPELHRYDIVCKLRINQITGGQQL